MTVTPRRSAGSLRVSFAIAGYLLSAPPERDTRCSAWPARGCAAGCI